MVFVVASDLPEKKILRIIEKHAHTHTSVDNTNPYFKKETDGLSKVYIENIQKETEHVQSYIILGGEASASGSSQKLKETLLMNILGGPALNSRLNLGIREKYGFTYHIEAGSTHFSDTGFYHCFAGTDKQYIDRTYELILKELRKLKDNKMGSIQMLNSLNQFIGQIMISEENKLSSAMAVGRQWLQGEKLVTIHDLMLQINQFTATDILETANRLFDQNNIAVLKYLPSANE
jgi:predicted Zn-dependent peptidase